MKKIMMMLIFVAFVTAVAAQSKQVKMYQEQIKANTVYMQYLKKAITIARSGLTTVSDIRNAEFNLHDLFFKGLRLVNPKIRTWSKVADIISLQVNIVKSYKASLKQIKASGQFNEPEINYIFSVFSKLLDDCAGVVEMLADIMTDDTYNMSDDERIHRVDVLYTIMQSNYTFCQKFSHNNLLLAMHRSREKKEAAESKLLFGIR